MDSERKGSSLLAIDCQNERGTRDDLLDLDLVMLSQDEK
jgi:hypothetical protein